jgi:hypothetical protein
MKKIFVLNLVILSLMITTKVFAQGFIKEMEGEGFSALYGNECIVTLKSGDVIHGKFTGGSSSNNGLNKITIKLENGEKVKYTAEEVVLLKIKCSELAKMFMMTDATVSVKEMANTDFNEIVNREYLIFEEALLAKKADKYSLLQLLNPGFDSKIKVYPTSEKTMGMSLGGIPITGGSDKSYQFVKGGQKAFKISKGDYKKKFESIYGDCPEMISRVTGEKLKWEDLAAHVFIYDQLCK